MSPKILFQSALTCYNAQQFSQAETLCRQLLKLASNSADVLHLLAMSLAKSKPNQAKEYFEQAIAIAHNNYGFKKNYANFLLSNQYFSEALPFFQQLYQQIPDDCELAYGIAFIKLQQRHYRAALEIISNTRFSPSQQAKWQTLQARALLECGETDAAAQVLNKARRQAPQHSGLALSQILLLRQQQQPEQALVQLQQLPTSAMSHYLAGCLHYDLQQYQQSEYHLLQALALQPDYIDAHAALNKLYWEHNNQDEFLRSFKQALAVNPGAVGLYLSYISHLVLADRLEQAFDVTRQAIQQCGEQHPLLHTLGTLHYKQQDTSQAFILYQQALSQAPHHTRYLLDNANLLLKKADYQAALTLLQRAKQLEPDNQEVWAYLGLCWRLMAAPQHDWLNNYHQLISVKKLATPAGYTSFSAFWQQLKEAVNALHTTEQQPLDQSVRNGTQTVGFLFNNPAKVIQDYRQLLTEHLQQYIAALPQDQEHPLLRRIAPAFRFSGCWSVKLHGDGFHTNHVHPQGWLSVCTYLQVPNSITADDPLKHGWLKLGETSLKLDDREQIAQSVCPEEGLCVIFPSYTWHGTVPFQDDDARITLPCDIVPDI